MLVYLNVNDIWSIGKQNVTMFHLRRNKLYWRCVRCNWKLWRCVRWNKRYWRCIRCNKGYWRWVIYLENTHMISHSWRDIRHCHTALSGMISKPITQYTQCWEHNRVEKKLDCILPTECSWMIFVVICWLQPLRILATVSYRNKR